MIITKHRFKLDDDHFILITYNQDERSNYDHFISVFNKEDKKYPLVGTTCKEGNKETYLILGAELLNSYLKNKDNNFLI